MSDPLVHLDRMQELYDKACAERDRLSKENERLRGVLEQIGYLVEGFAQGARAALQSPNEKE